MPRDIPVGNGSLLINFDDRHQLRDLYYPHVGQENHAGAGASRFGVWAESPTNTGGGKLAWTSDDEWAVEQRYLDQTLTYDTTLRHDPLKLRLELHGCVDFHRNLYVRKITVHNDADHDRLVKVFHQGDFNMFGTKIGDTAYYDPDLRSLVHYRAKRYLMTTFFVHGEQRVDEYATGTSGFGGHEGTWRDAEDGKLQMNPIAQGAVDSTVACSVRVRAKGEQTLYMAIVAGQSREELEELHKWLIKQGPQRVIDRTSSYWR
ncbi:MAG: glycoside hydrolase family 15 protein, partial [Planctomycetota bacterium]